MAAAVRKILSALAALCILVVAACSSSGSRVRSAGAPSPDAAPKSIVQLGDSVASGEGTLYGYTYDPIAREWTGGNINAPWPPPYPMCHDSPDAYGQLLATGFGASFHQFGCTGATFASGIAGPEISNFTQLRPAEFGNWATQQNLNPDYDAAAPDLVLVTLGADDVQFVNIITECLKNGYEFYFDITSTLQCTKDDPGPTIQRDFTKFLPTLAKNYGSLASWISARATANHVAVPKVVFTTYPNPFPPKSSKCPDTSWFYPAQVAYLSSLLQKMDQTIVSTIQGLKMSNVAVVDLQKAYQPNGVDHRWCTGAPWAYGLSIYHVYDPSTFKSQAPFHPTPAGQQSIAQHVAPAVARLFNTVTPARRPADTSTTATGAK